MNFGEDLNNVSLPVGYKANDAVNAAGILQDYGYGPDGSSLGGGYFDNMDFGGMAKGFGTAVQGVGGLAQAWVGMQNLKLAEKVRKDENAQWEKNYQAQRSDIAYDHANREAARSRQSEASAIG